MVLGGKTYDCCGSCLGFGVLGNCSCVTLDNCSCIVLGRCSRRGSTSYIPILVPSPILGLVPPAYMDPVPFHYPCSRASPSTAGSRRSLPAHIPVGVTPAWPRPASRPVPGLTFSLQSSPHPAMLIHLVRQPCARHRHLSGGSAVMCKSHHVVRGVLRMA